MTKLDTMLLKKNGSSRPRLLLPTLSLLFLALPLFASGGEEATEVEPIAVSGRIEYLEGDVSVNGSTVDIGAGVETGDVVTTGAASVAEIVFGGRNVFRLEPDTRAEIAFLEQRQEVSLEAGAFSAVFEDLVTLGDGESDSFRLRTNTAIAGVRGTTFYVKIEDPDSTFICTCHGTLSIDPFGDPSPFSVTNYGHEAYRFRRDNGDVVVEPEIDLYHSSDDLNRLADRIDVTIPWGEAPN